MPTYWTYRSLPELAPLTPKERRLILQRLWWKPFLHLKVWLSLIPYLLLSAACPFYPLLALHYKIKLTFTLRILCSVFSAFCPVAVILLLKAFVFIPAIRPYLRSQFPGFCQHCGYDLRASTNRCPECNTPFTQPQTPGR